MVFCQLKRKRNGFDSKLVRLEVIRVAPLEALKTLEFRFQTGAIKRLTELRKPCTVARFDSRLVRLEVS